MSDPMNGNTERPRRKCGGCQYRFEATRSFHKRKVWRCGKGEWPHYRVGADARCHQIHPEYEDVKGATDE